MQNDARTCSFVISVMYERLLNADKYSPALLLCVIEAGDLLDSVKMPSGFGVLPVKRTMKNNNFFSVSLLTGWRYFYAAFNVSS